ncbi:MAG: phytanoyl-CoA dioxygenase family protein [Caldilineaceae bacterium]|nr:phytanoyl-CoA dioxygenase family protein [Caldilineaceae bacterium]
MVTQEQIDFFRDKGYLRFGPVLEQDEVDLYRGRLDQVIDEENRGGRDDEHEFKYGHRRPGETEEFDRPITQYINMWKRDDAYLNLLHHPVITGAAKALLGTDRLRLWHDQIISKPPHDNGHFHFHQDFYLWPLMDPNILTCWLALDDVDPSNGSMHVVPSSHRDPRFGLESYAAEMEAIAAAEARGETIEPSDRVKMRDEPASIGLSVDLPAGGCMFHHCLNFHATPPNVTERQRRAHIMIFMADGVRVNLNQSGQHPLIPGFEVGHGAPLIGQGFPVCDAEFYKAA